MYGLSQKGLWRVVLGYVSMSEEAYVRTHGTYWEHAFCRTGQIPGCSSIDNN